MKLKWVWALANFYMTLWYLCINTHYGKIYIPKYMHACVCAIFAFLLMLCFILKVPKRVRHDLLQQDYVTKAPFTEMQTRKFLSKGSVLIFLWLLSLPFHEHACVFTCLCFCLCISAPFIFLDMTWTRPIPNQSLSFWAKAQVACAGVDQNTRLGGQSDN